MIRSVMMVERQNVTEVWLVMVAELRDCFGMAPRFGPLEIYMHEHGCVLGEKVQERLKGHPQSSRLAYCIIRIRIHKLIL